MKRSAIAAGLLATALAVTTARAEDGAAGSPPRRPLHQLLEVNSHVLLANSESGAGFLLTALSKEQARRWGATRLYVVEAVEPSYVALRSAEPVDTAFGKRSIQKNIAAHAIAEIEILREPDQPRPALIE